MFVVVKPQLDRLADRYRKLGRLTPDILAVVLIGILVSAYLTSKIGIHSIFGAFLFGVIMPRRETADFFHQILERLEQVSVLLLLPVFFIVTGLGVDVRGLGGDALTQLPLILLVAVAGKMIGATVAARAQGLAPRKAGAVGVLMNTRGLTELVILNVGREFEILDQRLFTMLVVMAVVTTIMTEPALRLVYPDRLLLRDIAEAERAAMGLVEAYRVVVAVGDPLRSEHLVDAAVDIIGHEEPSEILLTRFSPATAGLELGTGFSGQLAEVAGVLEQMKALARRAEDRGATCVIRTQFSDDIAGDLIAQVTAVEGNVLLLGAELDLVAVDDRPAVMARLLRDTPCEVAILVDPMLAGITAGPGNPVVAVTGEDAHAVAALELGIRVAVARGAPIALVAADASRKNTRHVTEWVDKLQRAGIEADIHPGDRTAGGGLVTRGIEDGGIDGGIEAAQSGGVVPGGAMLLVRAPVDDDGRLLERLLEGLVKSKEPAPAAETAAPIEVVTPPSVTPTGTT
jgi:hypothetical protein